MQGIIDLFLNDKAKFKYIDEGKTRVVYEILGTDLVLKVEKEPLEMKKLFNDNKYPLYIQNKTEWEIWNDIKDKDCSKYFAKCVDISNDGKYLTMVKCDNSKMISKSNLLNIKRKIPNTLTSDISTLNFGIYKNKYVILDYASSVNLEKHFKDNEEIINKCRRMKILTKEKFMEITKLNEGNHWTKENLEKRWDYHKAVIDLVTNLKLDYDVKTSIELGTMGVKCLLDSDTMDYDENWDFVNKNPTYLHDARITPWPIKNKQYDVFIGLRVFQHLSPFQQEAFNEAKRIANHVILVVPEIYKHKIFKHSKGITLEEFIKFNNGKKPNLIKKTRYGALYYWDFRN